MIIAFLLEAQGKMVSTVFGCAHHFESPARAMVFLFLFNCTFTPFLGWDTTAISLTPHVLNLCASKRWRVRPFSTALTMSCNIGSVLTPVSNPGNVLVVLASLVQHQHQGSAITPTPISFLEFMAIVAVPWAFSAIFAVVVLVGTFWTELCQKDCDDCDSGESPHWRCAQNREATNELKNTTVSRAVDLESGNRAAIPQAPGSSYISRSIDTMAQQQAQKSEDSLHDDYDEDDHAGGDNRKSKRTSDGSAIGILTPRLSTDGRPAAGITNTISTARSTPIVASISAATTEGSSTTVKRSLQCFHIP
jgi:hypothetical protein